MGGEKERKKEKKGSRKEKSSKSKDEVVVEEKKAVEKKVEEKKHEEPSWVERLCSTDASELAAAFRALGSLPESGLRRAGSDLVANADRWVPGVADMLRTAACDADVVCAFCELADSCMVPCYELPLLLAPAVLYRASLHTDVDGFLLRWNNGMVDAESAAAKVSLSRVTRDAVQKWVGEAAAPAPSSTKALLETPRSKGTAAPKGQETHRLQALADNVWVAQPQLLHVAERVTSMAEKGRMAPVKVVAWAFATRLSGVSRVLLREHLRLVQWVLLLETGEAVADRPFESDGNFLTALLLPLQLALYDPELVQDTRSTVAKMHAIAIANLYPDLLLSTNAFLETNLQKIES